MDAMPINASLGNRAFGKKILSYRRGSFSEIEVATKYLAWNRAAISNRGESILNFMEQRWTLLFKDYGIKPKECLTVPELLRK
jgi:hypothetical protein